ncbi:MAG: hypothetical protein E4H28_08300 [Gemmatimonadales bacterium]|nr:MAG: hypothetical protein E4H28_08300 [Gemmatimonadales bacterium]
MILYWTFFFLGAIESGPPGSSHYAFESAFPPADALLCLAALAAGVTLLRGAHGGVFFLVIASSMSLYLGVLDVSFYGRLGLYFPLNETGSIELVVNLLCIVGGAIGVRLAWLLWDGIREAGR